MNKNIKIIGFIFSFLLFGLIGHFVYFMSFESEDAVNNPYNKRASVLSEKIVRGTIYSADMEVLAETLDDNTRNYPYGKMYAHVVGRFVKGKTGIEGGEELTLLQIDKYDRETLINEIKGVKNKGNSIITTLDHKLTLAADDAMGDNAGAVIVLNPKTGAILTMISKPSYDPNIISDIWEKINSEENDEHQLLNRATSGLYPPGSTFKVITAMEYLREYPDEADVYSFKCSGKYSDGGAKINCHNNKKHGTVDLFKSLAYSCNTSFANIGSKLDINKYKSFVESIGFNKALDISFAMKTSSFGLKDGDPMWDIFQTSIGQGRTLITPLHNALIMSAIYNNGILKQPFVLDRVIDGYGRNVKKYEQASDIRLIDEALAKKMQELLSGVASIGTAKSMKTHGFEIFGKTGSAEYDSNGNSHAWFSACAVKEGKEPIVICVLVENGVTGAESAVPVAEKILECYAK